LNKKGYVDFIKKSAEDNGESMTAADLAETEKKLENVNFAGDVWVGSQSGVLNQFKGTLKLVGGVDESSGTMSLNFTLGNINKAVTVDAPADAKEFTESMLVPIIMTFQGGAALPADGEIPAGIVQ
jgi:hypothetical protein